MEDFVTIASPLTRLAQKGVKFEWSLACEKSFQELKQRLVTTSILALPKESQDYVIYSDA